MAMLTVTMRVAGLLALRIVLWKAPLSLQVLLPRAGLGGTAPIPRATAMIPHACFPVAGIGRPYLARAH
jgi:hypothetical protein